MKTASAQLESHLAQEVTSLCTIWRITRTDGETFRFTDHDVDLVFEGNTYKASAGYNSSAVESNSGLNVDNLETSGFLDDSSLAEAELRAGLFDYADVRISVVNWKDLSQGEVRLRRGTLGEVSYSEITGTFQAELRGMTQLFSQVPIELYQAECRADLGDSRCKIAITPDLVQRETTYAVGDRVRVDFSQEPGLPLGLTNGGFETGDLTGWTTVTGTPAVTSGNAKEGTYKLHGENSEDYEVSQIADLSGSLNTTLVDAGDARITASAHAFQSTPGEDDLGRFIVEALDGADALISTIFDSGYDAWGSTLSYEEVGFSALALPSGTRKIRARLLGQYGAGTIVNAVWDDVSGFINYVAPDPVPEDYHDVYLECTTAGTTSGHLPTYDDTIGADTTDGTAVFETKKAFNIAAVVATVTDNREFTITFPNGADSREVDDWFTYGAVIWATGDNAGMTMEVKNFVASSDTVSLFLQMPFDVQSGDKLEIYAGCDKQFATCRDKFSNVNNFRGEPYVPGQDELMDYPTR